MTISDKIRIYELSRDLNLENKDILDAAQKLSISVKSHSSSISAEDAKKIKNLINKKNSGKKILSINKPSNKEDNYKQKKEAESPLIPSVKETFSKDNSDKKSLLTKPRNKPDSLKIIPNQLKNPNKPNVINSSKSQSNPTYQNQRNKPSQNFNQDKKTFQNNTNPSIKSPVKHPIQLIAKPKNLNNNRKLSESSKNIYTSGDKKQLSNKSDQNTNKPKIKNFNNRINTPELVGAPIRRNDQNKSGAPNRPGMTNNRPGLRNRPSDQSRPGSFNRQVNPNRPGAPSRPGIPNKPGLRNRPSDQSRPDSFNRQVNPNRPGAPSRPGMTNNRPNSKFNSGKSSGIRKPVSPNELLQLQKTNKSEKNKSGTNNNETKTIESPNQKVKPSNNRPNSAPSSKKQPHRAFSNTSKKPGRSDWDDSAKLEALRNKNPQKQRQKVHIIGENDDSLTSETSGYSGEKVSILSASLARPKK